MKNVLIVAEHGSGTLRKATLHALSAGREIARRTGGTLHAAVLGKGIGAVARELASYGVEVRAADAPGLEHLVAEGAAPVLAEIAKYEYYENMHDRFFYRFLSQNNNFYTYCIDKFLENLLFDSIDNNSF